MGNGAAVCTLSVATTRNWKNRDTGERQEETEWHRVVLYEQRAEFAGQYLKKGRSVYVEGRLKTRKWQDKDGIDRYTTEIIADDIKPLDYREQGGGDGDDDGHQGNRQSQNQGGGRDGGGQYRAQGQQRGQSQGQPRGNGGGGYGGGGYGGGNGRGAPQGGRSSASGRAPAAAGHGDFDDDIPFAESNMSMESKLERRIRRRNGRMPMSSIEG